MKLLIIKGGLRTQALEEIIEKELTESGHVVDFIDPPSKSRLTNEEFNELVTSRTPDAVYYETPSYGDLLAIRQLKCKKILNHTTPTPLATYDYEFDKADFDCMLTNSWAYHKKYRYERRMGHTVWMPSNTHKTDIYHHLPDKPLDVSFVGSNYDTTHVDSVFFNNTEISKEIWGTGWSHPEHKGVLLGRPNSVYSKSKLGFTNISQEYLEFGLKPRRLGEILSSATRAAVTPAFAEMDLPGARRAIDVCCCANDVIQAIEQNPRKNLIDLETAQARVFEDGYIFLAKLISMLEN